MTAKLYDDLAGLMACSYTKLRNRAEGHLHDNRCKQAHNAMLAATKAKAWAKDYALKAHALRDC